MRFHIGDSVFASAISWQHDLGSSPIIVGLCGSQGSGKSTTSRRLQDRLASMGKRTAICSLDDYYLTRAERSELARHVHPLLVTRGVPGTHDVDLLKGTMAALKGASADSVIAMPLFDKAANDRVAPADWPRWQGQADVILLEGWCIGARPQPAAALIDAVNDLERAEDPHGIWRTYVNDQLAGPYASLFAMMDLRLMLRAPDFSCVRGWRAEQEAGLPRDGSGARPAMDEAALLRFISHYERITRWLIETQPADIVATLAPDRSPVAWHMNQETTS